MLETFRCRHPEWSALIRRSITDKVARSRIGRLAGAFLICSPNSQVLSTEFFRLLRSCPKWGQRELVKAVVRSEVQSVVIELRFDTVRSNDESLLVWTSLRSVQPGVRLEDLYANAPMGPQPVLAVVRLGLLLARSAFELSRPELDRPFMAARLAAKSDERCRTRNQASRAVHATVVEHQRQDASSSAVRACLVRIQTLSSEC